MISSEAFYKELSRELPEYLEMAAEVVGMRKYLPQQIAQDFNSEGLTSLMYSNKERRLEFYHMGFEREFLELKKFYDMIFGNYTLDHHKKALLSQIPMFLIHDMSTKYQFSKQLMDLFQDKEKEEISMSNSVRWMLARAAQEGIAKYGSKTILQKMNCAYIYNNMETAKNTQLKILARQFAPIYGDFVANRKTGSDMIMAYWEMINNQSAIRFMSTAYSTLFEKEGIDFFREFVRAWRPAKISEKETSKILQTFWENVLYFYELPLKTFDSI